jgi:hypothetical protein
MNLTDVIAILEALAEGTDPRTGEALPDGSPYHEPYVIRALYRAARQLRQQHGQPKSPLTSPARAGSPWTAEEDQQLIQQFDATLALLTIARKHQRTHGSILARLIRLGKLTSRHDSTAQDERNHKGKPPGKWWIEEGRTQAGKAWTPQEDEALVRDFHLGMPLEQLAQRLRRGVNAVEVRLAKLGISSAVSDRATRENPHPADIDAFRTRPQN